MSSVRGRSGTMTTSGSRMCAELASEHGYSSIQHMLQVVGIGYDGFMVVVCSLSIRTDVVVVIPDMINMIRLLQHRVSLHLGLIIICNNRVWRIGETCSERCGWQLLMHELQAVVWSGVRIDMRNRSSSSSSSRACVIRCTPASCCSIERLVGW